MEEVSLEDPRWCAMVSAIDQRRQQHSISAYDAIIDLERAMETRRLRSMRRNVATGAREQLEDLFWIDHRMDLTDFGSIVIYRLNGEGGGSFRQWGVFDHPPHQRIDGHAYYVWQPDLDRLNAPSAPLFHSENDSSAPVKPGPKPRGDWHTVLAQWLISVAAHDPNRVKKPNIDALAAEAQQFLHECIQWAPSDNKVLRSKIRELLGEVRS